MVKPINLLEYEAQALEKLPLMARDYYRSGAMDEITLRNNRRAFDFYQLRPRVLVDVSCRDLSTSILGQSLSMPILIAPMAFQCLAHPEGEIATAKAAAKMKTAMVLSTMSTKSLEDIAGVLPKNQQWFQLYILRDRGLTRSLVERAENLGFNALCVTVDTPVMGRREVDVRNQFILPKGMIPANLVSSTDSNDSQTSPSILSQQIDPSVTWKDLEWLQSLTKLPIVVKGILRADDARLACDRGAKGIIVSNHGGRQLDGAISSLEALPEIVTAVGERVEVMIDGGVRRGTDILKALALGAKAVLVGRPILWGLTIDGQAGVQHVLELLRDELQLAMALCGCPSIQHIDSSSIESINNDFDMFSKNWRRVSQSNYYLLNR
jgi:4-hydroxymandelate oxidase